MNWLNCFSGLFNKNTIHAWTGTIKNENELLLDIDIFTSILNLMNYNGQIREHQD